MKAQISLLVASLTLAPLFLSAQPLPPFKKPLPVNSSSVEQETTLVSSPSLFEEAESVSCPTPVTLFNPDSNETSSEIAERYARAHRLMVQGAWRRARLVLERGIEKFPESRHLRMLYADLLWYLSRGGQNRALLEQAAQEAIRAMEIGLSFDIVDYRLINRLSQTLGRTGDTEAFERLFTRALALDPGPFIRRHYALGLSRMGSARAEDAFKAAIELEDEEDAHVDYGEWLLDRNRVADALNILPRAPIHIYYLHFLRGVALEKSDLPDEARRAYSRFRDFSGFFPAPARFRIKGSKLQRESGIHFDDETGAKRSVGKDGITNVTAPLTDQEGIKGLSYTIWGEARGENYGGMLAAGWVARTRVVRGSVAEPNTCPAVTRTGATLADWYKSVMCQSGAFDGVCSAWCTNPATTSCTSNPTTDSAAYDVFNGLKADPVSGHCPGGVRAVGDLCASTQTCYGEYYSYRMRSPLFNLGISGSSSCGTHLCAPDNYGKVCGNGGTLENCFYGNDACAGTNRYGYVGTLNSTTTAMVTPAYYAPPGIHRGHLEGPEIGADFDLEFQYSSSSAGPWQTIEAQAGYGSVEELDVQPSYAGYFRYRIVRYSGSGDFFICTKRPS